LQGAIHQKTPEIANEEYKPKVVQSITLRILANPAVPYYAA